MSQYQDNPKPSAYRPPGNSPARLKRSDHARLWMCIEGAVIDAVKMHPDYLTKRGRENIVESVTKRVIGSVIGILNP